MRDAVVDANNPQLASDLIAAIREIESALRADSDLLEVFSIEGCVAATRIRNPYSYTAVVPHSQAEILQRIRKRYDSEIVSRWNWLTLLRAIEYRLHEAEFRALPRGVHDLSVDWFERILAESQNRESDCDLINTDGTIRWDTCVDFAVAAGRMLPVGGAWVVERKIISRDALFGTRSSRANASRQIGLSVTRMIRRQLLRALSYIRLDDLVRHTLRKYREATGKYDSYLVIHTANHYRRWFSEKFQRVAFENIAALLAAESSLRGLYRSGWLLDPQIAEMEPRLAFLTATPIANGAKYEFLGSMDVKERKEILEFSSVRREKYESGAYHPEQWAYFWSRESIAEWEESQ
ncbi:MAG: hypothetical protein ACR2QQ_01390 [Gammaproteobacteria bacterium]